MNKKTIDIRDADPNKVLEGYFKASKETTLQSEIWEKTHSLDKAVAIYQSITDQNNSQNDDFKEKKNNE